MTGIDFMLLPYNHLCQRSFGMAQEVFAENYRETLNHTDLRIRALYEYGRCLALLGLLDNPGCERVYLKLTNSNQELASIIRGYLDNGYSEDNVIESAYRIRDMLV